MWIPESIRDWALGEAVESVVRGTENENEPGYLF